MGVGVQGSGQIQEEGGWVGGKQARRDTTEERNRGGRTRRRKQGGRETQKQGNRGGMKRARRETQAILVTSSADLLYVINPFSSFPQSRKTIPLTNNGYSQLPELSAGREVGQLGYLVASYPPTMTIIISLISLSLYVHTSYEIQGFALII